MSTRDGQSKSASASANLSRRSNGNIERDKGGATVKSTGISFTAGGTIEDSNSGFGALAAGDAITVRGSPKNSRQFEVTAAAAASLTVTPAVVSTEATGALITISRDG